jgi:hypothetical protein
LGGSTRRYIFNGPEDLKPPELPTATAIRQMKLKAATDRAAAVARGATGGGNGRDDNGHDGIGWGIDGEDAVEVDDEDEVQRKMSKYL